MIFKINLDIYDRQVLVIYDETKETIEKFLKRFKLSKDDLHEFLVFPELPYKDGRTILTESGALAILLKPSKSPGYLINVISHEVLHTVCYIANQIGLELSPDSVEAYCYLNGYLNEVICSKLKINCS